MQKWLISWILPFVIAIFIVAVFKVFLVQFYLVYNDSMNSSLAKGDRVICLKSEIKSRGDVVLIRWAGDDNFFFKRIIGLPNDTVFARRSIIFINSKRFREPEEVVHKYSFSTDSQRIASKLLEKKQIDFDSLLASIGVFQFNASLDDLKMIKQDSMSFDAKRLISEPTVIMDNSKLLNPRFYWNKDNFGPLVVPAKGTRIKITLNHYYLYKPIIEMESGKSLEIIRNQVYIDKTEIGFYEFKQNYYFVLNDNRQDVDDSRSKGFISEEDILSEFWFKLPW